MQLCSDIASGKSFAKFSEGTIDFPPSVSRSLCFDGPW